MKHLNIVSLSLLLLLVSFACSMNTSDGKLLFGEDFGLADYEEGSTGIHPSPFVMSGSGIYSLFSK